MMWFIKDKARFHHEFQEMAALTTEVDWLPVAEWNIDKGKLCLVADIEVHRQLYEVQMIYPANYPASPPTVRPRKNHQHWSSHQFGYGGELCLEWGPDNWRDEITGTDILRSAHKLFTIENPKNEGTLPEIAPSRHSLTLGQELSLTFLRFLVDDDFVRYTQSLPANTWGEAQCLVMCGRASATAIIQTLTPTNVENWCNSILPAELEKTTTQIKFGFFKTTVQADDLKSPDTNQLINLLKAQGYDVSQLRKLSSGLVLLVDSNGFPHLFLVSNQNEWTPFSRISIHDESENGRLSPEFSNLATKTVGIVGLGSAGSKIALSLARSGVRNIVLVDHDLFLPGNICRHELTWEDVGQHKIDGIAHQLKLIARDAEVVCHHIKLSGQEATAKVDGVLSQLGASDLIVDATADSTTFNQLSAVASQQETPMVWLEIFAGGIGGLIARYRPNRDPDPKTMRAYLLEDLAQHNAPEINATVNYAANDSEGVSLVASVADVGVIAENASRMALDILTEHEPSQFPCSMYLIGLSRSWIFNEPFYTIPIDFSNVELTITVPHLSQKEEAEATKILTQLISNQEHENLPPKSN